MELPVFACHERLKTPRNLAAEGLSGREHQGRTVMMVVMMNETMMLMW